MENAVKQLSSDGDEEEMEINHISMDEMDTDHHDDDMSINDTNKPSQIFTTATPSITSQLSSPKQNTNDHNINIVTPSTSNDSNLTQKQQQSQCIDINTENGHYNIQNNQHNEQDKDDMSSTENIQESEDQSNKETKENNKAQDIDLIVSKDADICNIITQMNDDYDDESRRENDKQSTKTTVSMVDKENENAECKLAQETKDNNEFDTEIYDKLIAVFKEDKVNEIMKEHPNKDLNFYLKQLPTTTTKASSKRHQLKLKLNINEILCNHDQRVL